ncbi:hypothetical protein V8C86DRAFT_2488580 [Haematococcus lacustris]
MLAGLRGWRLTAPPRPILNNLSFAGVATASNNIYQTEVKAAMDTSVAQLIEKIHAAPPRVVLVTTGGAAQAVAWLLTVPGASNTVLEANVPYCRGSLVDLLGQEPEQYCSAATAIDMARVAFQRAATVASFGVPLLGVAATCSLASVPLKRGAHRAYLAVHGVLGDTHVIHVNLAKGRRTREEEEHYVSCLLLNMLASASGLPAACQLALPTLGPSTQPGNQQPCATASVEPIDGATPTAPPSSLEQQDVVEEQHFPGGSPLQLLLDGHISCVEYAGGQVVVDAPRRGKVLLSGSFNPLHQGHTQLLQAACEMYGQPGDAAFELSVGNADKGLLPLAEVERRITQFVEAGLPLLVTRAPLFVHKATLLRNSQFVVGWDTAVRMVMPKYYDDSEVEMMLVFERIRAAGCKIIVAGRKDSASEEFKTLADVVVPPALRDLFTEVPAAAFRVDLSSTQLRQQQQQQAV